MGSNKDLFAINENDSDSGIENVSDQNIVEESSLEFEKILNLCIDEICHEGNSSCIGCHSENCLNERIIKKSLNILKSMSEYPIRQYRQKYIVYLMKSMKIYQLELYRLLIL